MSTTAPSKADDRGDAAPKTTPPGEADYIARQAAEASAAISNTLRAITGDLKQTVDVRLWTKEHPWMSVGAAAAAGFVAACMVVPTKEDQALRRLAKIEKALNPSHPPVGSSSDGAANQQEYKSGRQSFWTSIAKEIIGAVKPVLLSTLTAGVTAQASQPQPQPPNEPPI